MAIGEVAFQLIWLTFFLIFGAIGYWAWSRPYELLRALVRLFRTQLRLVRAEALFMKVPGGFAEILTADARGEITEERAPTVIRNRVPPMRVMGIAMALISIGLVLTIPVSWAIRAILEIA